MNIRRMTTCRCSFLALAFIIGCSDKEPTGPIAGLGSNTVTKYVAIGNSLTAGYQSGALYASGQNYSFPKIIAEQLKLAGASLQPFEQPLYGDPGNADPTTGKAARLEILDFSSAVPTIGPRGIDPGAPLNTALARPYDNLGIPGIPLASFLDTTNFLSNPFSDLILRSAGGLPKSVFRQVQILQPDLVTFWLGNNDVLGYATSGGTSPAAPTPSGIFSALYTQALDTLRDILPTAKIIVGNIPDVTTIPYFTTVGPSLQQLGIKSIWGIRAGGDTVVMNLSSNLLTLTAQTPLGAGKGLQRSDPLPSSVILDSLEIATAQTSVAAYNATIASVAASKNAVVFDANAYLRQIHTSGYYVAGEVYTSAYLSGGLFSLDGVHPSSRGYGLVANEIIRLMNSQFGMSIPLTDVSKIPGIPVPASRAGGPVVPAFAAGAFKDFDWLFASGTR